MALAYTFCFKQIQVGCSPMGISLSLPFSHQLPSFSTAINLPLARHDLPFFHLYMPNRERKLSGTGCSLPSRPEWRRCSPRSQPNPPSFSFSISRCFGFFGRAFAKERRKLMSLPRFFGTAQQKEETSSFQVGLSATRLSRNTFYRAHKKQQEHCQQVHTTADFPRPWRTPRPRWMGPWAAWSSLAFKVEVGSPA